MPRLGLILVLLAGCATPTVAQPPVIIDIPPVSIVDKLLHWCLTEEYSATTCNEWLRGIKQECAEEKTEAKCSLARRLNEIMAVTYWSTADPSKY
jgi:hypothetical protein